MGLPVIKGEGGHGRSCRIHGGSVSRKVLHQGEDLSRKRSVRRELRAELLQGVFRGQRAEPQEEGGCCEGTVARQVVDVDAPVASLALATQDVAEGGVRRLYLLEATVV